MREEALDLKVTLIIIDTIVDAFGGNENDRAQVRQFDQMEWAVWRRTPAWRCLRVAEGRDRRRSAGQDVARPSRACDE